MAGKFEIKAVVTGASQGAEEIKKLGDATAQAGQKIEKSGEVTEKATRSKNRLVDAFKKLKTEVPLVGAAVDTFKNPIAAVTIAAAAAVNVFRQFNEQIDALGEIIGNGRIADQMGNIRSALAGAAADAEKFSRALDAIQKRPEAVAEQGTRLAQERERRLKVEASRDEIAKAGELAAAAPEDRPAIEAKFAARAKQRDQRRIAGEANDLAQAQFRAQDIVREGVAALPGARDALTKAAIRRDELLATADAQTVDVGALEKNLAAAEKGRFLGGVQDFLNPAGKSNRARRAAGLIEGARNNNANAAALRVTANAEFEAALQDFNSLQSRTLGAAEDVRKFSIQRGAAVADAAAFQPFNDPGAVAGVAAQRKAQAAADAAAEKTGPAFEAAFLKILRRLEILERNSSAQSQSP